MESPVALLMGAGASACFGKETAVGFLRNLNYALTQAIPSSEIERLRLPDDWVYEIKESIARTTHCESNPNLVTRLARDVDLEDVLGYLEDLKTSAKVVDGLSPSFNPGWQAHDTARVKQISEILLKAFHTVIRSHYSTVPGAQSRDNSNAWPEDVYLPLLSELRDLSGEVPVFTTNYDLALEQAFSQGDWVLLDGFTTGDVLARHWSLRNYESLEASFGARTTCLFKLHGSCDWYYESPERVLNLNRFAPEVGDLQATAIYPQARKSELIMRHPFRELYDCLKSWIEPTTDERVRLLVVVGFSFREPQLNELLRVPAAAGRVRILWVDPNASEEHLLHAVPSPPFSRRVSKMEFGSDTIDDLVAHVKEALPA
ncbi:MAG: hypothetical protein BZY88_04795 [SAR202 cluster bacterium Io17-Chloro-G9]|nr:MAG: hypothetical protein BZY88_04795 [SAR202 cluster bacterium Io17-Chloro-G9]